MNTFKPLFGRCKLWISWIAMAGIAACSPGGSALAPLAPTSGAVVVSDNWKVSEVGNGFAAPQGVAVAASGNVLVSDTGHHVVKRVESSGRIEIVIKQEFVASPDQLAVDSRGDILLIDNSYGVKLFTAKGLPPRWEAKIAFAFGIAFDPQRNAYILERKHEALYEEPVPYTEFPHAVAKGVGSATALTIGAGHVYYMPICHGGYILKIFPTGDRTKLGHGIPCADGIAVDDYGSIFTTDNQHGRVFEVTASGKVSVIASSLHHPTAIATDSNGNVYVAESGANSVVKLQRP